MSHRPLLAARRALAYGAFLGALALLVITTALVSAAGAPGADVTIAKSASPSSVAVGGSYTYTLVVGNAGTAAATGVILSDGSVEPDVDVDFASLSWSPTAAGSCSWKLFGADPNNLSCDLGTLAVGAHVTVTFDVTAPQLTCPRVRNTAQVSATNEPVANQDNNSAVVNVPMTGCPSGTPGPSATATPTPSPGPTVSRIFGADRYATAALLSQRRVPSPGAGISAAYVASGQNFPDALAAGPAAAGRGTSVLLVTRDTIPPATRAELQRLKPATIYLAGGTGVVSAGVEAELKGLARSGNVVRFAGVDRYDTAARVVDDAFASATEVMIATGQNFPDALAGAAGAAKRGMPILLVRSNLVPVVTQAQIAQLNPSRIYIVGGTSVVNAAVEASLRSGGRTVVRIAGNDRYLTAVGVAKTFFHTGASHLFVATGLNFPDALVAGPLGDPVLLTAPTGLPAAVISEATRLDPGSIHVLGGPSIVSDTVINQLRGT